jgi:GNAT superfamily N-acetyltransferase
MQTVQSPTLAELQEAATDNIIEFYRFFCDHLDGTSVLDEPELFAAATGIPDEMMNGVFRTRLTADTSDAGIERAVGLFKSRKLPFHWWVGPTDSPADLGERLTAHGFVCETELPAMAVELDRLTSLEPAGPLEIKVVSDRETMSDWVATLIQACSMPAAIGAPILAAQERIGYGAGRVLRDYAGYEEGRMVATASVFLSRGVAAIYCVGTLEGARRKGYASAMVAHALSQARSEGLRYGVLQASRMGYPVYQRMGFRDTGHYKLFGLPPSATAANGQ